MQNNEELLEEVAEYKRALNTIIQSCPVDMRVAEWVRLQVFRHHIGNQTEDRLKLVEQRDEAKRGRYKR